MKLMLSLAKPCFLGPIMADYINISSDRNKEIIGKTNDGVITINKDVSG